MSVCVAYGQQDPVTIFADSGLQGTFCAYEMSESGDSPDFMRIVTAAGNFVLFAVFDNEADLATVPDLKPGTPVSFSYKADYEPHMIEDMMFTYIMVTEIKAVSGAPADSSVCDTGQVRPYGGYVAKGVSGHVCGYDMSTGNSQDRVFMKTGKGTFTLVPRLDRLAQLSDLWALPPGTPVTYDMTLMRSIDDETSGDTEPPFVVMDAWQLASGDRTPEICGESTGR